MYIGTLQASAIPFLSPQRNTLPLSLGYLLVESPEHNMTTLSTSSTPVPPVSMPTETFLADDPIASRISYLTSTTTTLIACIVPIIAIMYILLLSWTYQYSRRNPRPLNKTSGWHLQRYAPVVYVFLVLTSLSEVALASWLVLQYRFNHNYPTVQFRTGARLILFASSWTAITGGVYTLLFLHPSWSKHPISSIGAQAIWVFTTWLFWVVGVSIINPSVANLLGKGACEVVAYCSQIRGLYSVALVEIFTLTIGMAIMIWLAWESARYSVGPAIYPMN